MSPDLNTFQSDPESHGTNKKFQNISVTLWSDSYRILISDQTHSRKNLYFVGKKGKMLRFNCWNQIGWVMESTSEISKSVFLFWFPDCY